MMGVKSAFCLSLLFGGANGVPLLGGRFVTTTDVQGILDFSLDIDAMEGLNNPQEREQIYKNVRTRVGRKIQCLEEYDA
jgi:hypothetical protein